MEVLKTKNSSNIKSSNPTTGYIFQWEKSYERTSMLCILFDSSQDIESIVPHWQLNG